MSIEKSFQGDRGDDNLEHPIQEKRGSESRFLSNILESLEIEQRQNILMDIGIIGGGWYGCHLALVLYALGCKVTLFEKNDAPFLETSGKYGIRLHAGPHYPTSEETRKNCHNTFKKFEQMYEELLVRGEYSLYALANSDANGLPSKVNLETFEKVCQEFNFKQKITDPEKLGFRNTLSVMDVEEPSIVIGDRLRQAFKKYFEETNIELICNFEVKKLESYNDKIAVRVNEELRAFDFIINTSGYRALLPSKPLPFGIEIAYQPCLALIYQDRNYKEGSKPIPVIWMDGFLPCVMASCDSLNKDGKQHYILTNGKFTIMASCKTYEEAMRILNAIDDKFIKEAVKPNCENGIKNFWPAFTERFEYVGWKGSIVPKAITNSEFRSAFTFASEELIDGKPFNIIHVIPGKVSNVVDAQDEVIAYLNGKDILAKSGFQYKKDGVFHRGAKDELSTKPQDPARSTCHLQTYQLLREEMNNKKKADTIVPVTKIETGFGSSIRATSESANDTKPTFPSFFKADCKKASNDVTKVQPSFHDQKKSTFNPVCCNIL